MENKSMLEEVIDNLKQFNETKRIESNDTQIGGNHYKVMKIEPVTFIIENDIPFVEGNIIKYVCRWKSKGGVEDLKKARHYIDMLIKFNA
jgi:tRNA G37 N-methylase TrmD